MIKFDQLAEQMNGFRGRVFAFDPGETTGWAVFDDYKLLECGQIPTPDTLYTWVHIKQLFTQFGIKLPGVLSPTPKVVIEDYRVYSWKAKDHKWNELTTVKVLAIIELLARLYKLPLRLQLANHAKSFVTDEKLRAWGMWVKGERHARDAIRHACVHIIDQGLKDTTKK